MTDSAAMAKFDQELASKIDHTILKPEADETQIRQLCQEALSFCFASVCVSPIRVKLCAGIFAGAGEPTIPGGIKPVVCTVVGFPHGAQTDEAKSRETEVAMIDGASEIDMVIPIGALKDGNHNEVANHIAAVVKAAGSNALVKVIIENCYLTEAEKRLACRICADNGAGYVKTSTGFGSGGATLADVRLMREIVGDSLGVKAAGGIRDRENAWEFIRAGATRIGASSGIALTKL